MMRQDEFFKNGNNSLQLGQRWLFDNEVSAYYIAEIIQISGSLKLEILQIIYDLGNEFYLGQLISRTSLNKRKYNEYFWYYLQNQDL